MNTSFASSTQLPQMLFTLLSDCVFQLSTQCSALFEVVWDDNIPPSVRGFKCWSSSNSNPTSFSRCSHRMNALAPHLFRNCCCNAFETDPSAAHAWSMDKKVRTSFDAPHRHTSSTHRTHQILLNTSRSRSYERVTTASTRTHAPRVTCCISRKTLGLFCPKHRPSVTASHQTKKFPRHSGLLAHPPTLRTSLPRLMSSSFHLPSIHTSCNCRLPDSIYRAIQEIIIVISIYFPMPGGETLISTKLRIFPRSPCLPRRLLSDTSERRNVGGMFARLSNCPIPLPTYTRAG